MIRRADKLHNARSILLDLRRIGEALWDRFKGGREGTLWYYRALADAFAGTAVGPLARELEDTVGLIEEIS